MKILYAIQGTGNGHLARAIEIIPHLKTLADVDVLVSGVQGDLKLPFDVEYQLHGLSFIMGNKGGINYRKTVSQMRPIRFIADLVKLQVHNYDLVFTDFEPVSAWACLLKGKRSIGVSHQNAVLHRLAPRPDKTDWGGTLILKLDAPASVNYGFHFKDLDENHFSPIIRSGIRNAKPQNKGHYTVYLPAYSDQKIAKILAPFKQIRWEVFSKKCAEAYQIGNISFQPVSLEKFTTSFVNCTGILTTAGFETPSEALFMGKKLCVVPMKNQYEQLCNATFLEYMGVKVIHRLKKDKNVLDEWIESSSVIKINYPDQTRDLFQQIVAKHHTASSWSILQWFQSNFVIKTLQFKAISLRGGRLISLSFREKNDSVVELVKRIFGRN
ncbi:MAG: glycosyltransferase family protein [Prolixibacteraceae bacterium]